jgi:hypothetical protein
MNELDRVYAMARISVARACGFGALAIAMVSISLLSWPFIAFKLAALGCTLATAILVLKADRVRQRSHKTTEVWIMLERHVDVPESHVQRVVTNALYENFREFALYAAGLATLFWCLTLLAWLFQAPRVLT